MPVVVCGAGASPVPKRLDAGGRPLQASYVSKP